MEVDFKFDISKAGEKFLNKGLVEYNAGHCDYFAKHKYGRRKKHMGFYAYDGKTRIGGIRGEITYNNWVWIDAFFVDESYRGSDIGTKLMSMAEAFAIKNKCTGMFTDTWDFQAKGFYEKAGFRQYGQMNDNPVGTVVYCFEKKLI